MEYFGIDIGASGVKGSIVNLDQGVLKFERYRIPTPQPATPSKISDITKVILDHFDWHGPVGCGIPAVVKNGKSLSASNIHNKWIGREVNSYFEAKTGRPFYCLNDADAAGVAEMRFGIGRDYQKGVVIMLTLGTGIGSAIFMNRKLVSNTELGHIEFKGKIAEKLVADSVRKRKGLTWEKWGERFNEYLLYLERVFTPNAFILGGGGSKKFELYSHLLTPTTPVMPAEKLNAAGIIGAAYYSFLKQQEKVQ